MSPVLGSQEREGVPLGGGGGGGSRERDSLTIPGKQRSFQIGRCRLFQQQQQKLNAIKLPNYFTFREWIRLSLLFQKQYPYILIVRLWRNMVWLDNMDAVYTLRTFKVRNIRENFFCTICVNRSTRYSWTNSGGMFHEVSEGLNTERMQLRTSQEDYAHNNHGDMLTSGKHVLKSSSILSGSLQFSLPVQI